MYQLRTKTYAGAAARKHASGRDGTASPGGHPPRAQNGGAAGEGTGAAVGEDGKWFQALDEWYLLPVFSNATASRTFHARRARRRSTHDLSVSGGGAKGSAGPSVAGSKADVAGGEDEDGVELRVPLEQRLSGRTGTRPGDINIQPAQSRVTVGVRLERGSASTVLRSNGSGERLGEHRDMTHVRIRRRRALSLALRGIVPSRRRRRGPGCSGSWCDTLVDPDPEVEVEVAKEVEDAGVRPQAYPGQGGSGIGSGGGRKETRTQRPKTTRWMPRSKPLVRVACDSEPAQQPSPERLFTFAYTTALSSMHGDKDEHRLRATGIPGASRPASGLPATRAAGLRH
ncbi:hypothetical protein B0H14DRAFT_2611814 [Mycena olivaceomarginata]|nr:hypothetical protein B0H14DRAFT_2611814 [Mycena olivaceomarginata]